MFFPASEIKLFYILFIFLIFPIFTIISVLVFPSSHKKRLSYDEVADVPLCLLGIQGAVFIGFLGFFVYTIQKSTVNTHRFVSINYYLHDIQIFKEYEMFRIMVDSLNAPLIILNFILALTAIYYVEFTTTSVSLLQKSTVHILLVTFLINILFTTLNLGVFYVTFELLMIPLFFLIGMGSRLRRLRAVTLFVLYTVLFSFVMLFGLIYT